MSAQPTTGQVDLEAAGQAWLAALALNSQETMILLSLGSVEDEQGNVVLAHAYYRRALATDPESGPANRALGMFLAR